jgi:hypothetical protein
MFAGMISEPLIRYAGQDISHWFNSATKEVILIAELVRNPIVV